MRPYPPSVRSVVALLLGVVAAGCAAVPAPPEALPPPHVFQPGDFRRVAGTWEGPAQYGPATDGADPHDHTVTLIVRENGTFRFIYDNPPHTGLERFRRAGHEGKLQIRDGQLFYDFVYEEGVATLHEGSGGRVLRLQGKGKGGHTDGAISTIPLRPVR